MANNGYENIGWTVVSTSFRHLASLLLVDKYAAEREVLEPFLVFP
jgi:hypothetical protein